MNAIARIVRTLNCLGGLLILGVLPGAFAAAGETPQRQWTSSLYPPAFEHISVEHGLSDNVVHCMLQDHRGFLWIGTGLGLNRYDGFHFRTFHPDQTNPRSLSDDWITCLMEDRRGYLWIGTKRGGITIMDLDTLAMTPIRASQSPGGLPSNTIHGFAEDREGNVWVATLGPGLCLVPAPWRLPSAPEFKTFSTSDADPRDAPSGAVHSLLIDHAGTLWIGSRDRGLGRLIANPGNGKLVIDYHPLDNLPSDSASHIVPYTLREDVFGLIWVGSDPGPMLFDPGKGSFSQVAQIAAEANGIGAHRILDIHQDKVGNLWFASDGGGLYKLPPRRSPGDPLRFQRFAQDPKALHGLSGNGLQCLLEDASGVLWISSYQAGLNKLVLNHARPQDREQPSLFQYRYRASDPASLSGNTISAMGEDRFGNLWIGTDGFGLNLVRRPSKPGEPIRFERFREDPRHAPGSLQSDVVLTFHLDEHRQLWFGTYNGGLVRVNQASADARPTFTHFKTNPADPTTLTSNFIRYILDDGKGGFWVATDGTGLNHFHPKTGRDKHFTWGNGPKLLSSESIWCMAKDAYGTLWLATGTGLNRLNPETGDIRVYRPGGPGSINQARIHTLYLDKSGVLWIGTGGGGLNKTTVPPWDGPPPTFTSYGLQEGLPAKVVQGILPDHKGNLWLATDRALCRFEISQGRAYPFTWQSELQRAGFIWNACYRDTAGEMLFGSNDGLTLFHPEDILKNPVPPPIAITDFQILNQSMALQERMQKGSASGSELAITLYPKDTSLLFELAALHFVAPERNSYAFLMEGLDHSWKEAGNGHTASFTTLPPGDYVLRVRASNCDGVWGTEGFHLKIHVLPPWYKTWWFMGLALLGLVGSALSFLRVRLRVLRARNQHLEEVVITRTLELQQANRALEEMSLTDPLTGLRNRRFLSLCMPDEVAQVARDQQDVARNRTERMKLNIDVLVIMVDMDHFKYVNDTYGHLAGDKVLQQLGQILKEAVRTSDTVTRWGGEEFLIIARHSARADATLLPERIRAAVEAFPFDIDRPEPLHRTCSIGFSVFPLLSGETELYTWEQIVEIADTCLYAAKENGRNAWVGLIPDTEVTKADLDGRIPQNLEDIVKSGFLPVITSLPGPIRW